MEIVKVFNTHFLRTFDGRRFNKQIDVSKVDSVNVVLTEKIIANEGDVRISDSSLEKFAARDKTYEKFSCILN